MCEVFPTHVLQKKKKDAWVPLCSLRAKHVPQHVSHYMFGLVRCVLVGKPICGVGRGRREEENSFAKSSAAKPEAKKLKGGG